MSTIDPQQFGELRATVVQLERTLDNLNTDMKDLSTTVRELTDQISQARGGWKMLLVVAALGAGLASLADWLLSHVSLRP